MNEYFARPEYLILLACLPLLLIYILLREKKAGERRARFADNLLFSYLAIGRPRWVQILYRVFLIAGLFFLILAMARPLGSEKFETYEASGVDIVFALDVSQSMQAEDMQPTNRLTVTKLVVSHFIEKLQFDRVGIVAFAGDTSVQCPLTLDHDTAISFLNAMDYDVVKKNGTNLAEAILTANDRFVEDKNVARVIIVLTDGEEQEGKAVEAARKVAEGGTRIYTIGIGNTTGVPIPVGRTMFGKPVYKRFKGKIVYSKLEEKTLKDIAYVTGGKYYHVTDDKTLLAVLNEIRNMDKRMIRISQKAIRSEIFQYFLIPAFLFLIFSMFILERRSRIVDICRI
jgi:Ca-activated chloride channel family protein